MRILVPFVGMLLACCSAPAAVLEQRHASAFDVPLADPAAEDVRERDADLRWKEKVYELTVAASPSEDGAPSARGSAVMTRHDGRIWCVTAAHLLERVADSIVARDHKGRELRCVLVKAIYNLDIALLAVAQPELVDVATVVERVAAGDVKEGEPVVACGFADEHRWAFPSTAGMRTLRVEVKQRNRVFFNEVDVATRLLFGCSGGPVFNAAGELLGVCSCSNDVGSERPPAFFTAPGSLRWLLEGM